MRLTVCLDNCEDGRTIHGFLSAITSFTGPSSLCALFLADYETRSIRFHLLCRISSWCRQTSSFQVESFLLHHRSCLTDCVGMSPLSLRSSQPTPGVTVNDVLHQKLAWKVALLQSTRQPPTRRVRSCSRSINLCALFLARPGFCDAAGSPCAGKRAHNALTPQRTFQTPQREKMKFSDNGGDSETLVEQLAAVSIIESPLTSFTLGRLPDCSEDLIRGTLQTSDNGTCSIKRGAHVSGLSRDIDVLAPLPFVLGSEISSVAGSAATSSF